MQTSLQAEAEEKKLKSIVEELRQSEPNVRISAFRNILVVADALGPERTRDEFLPYLSEFTEDADDILDELAHQLGLMVRHVGGAEHAHLLLVPLERIAGSEESVIRTQAVDSIRRVSMVLSQAAQTEHLLPTVCRLAEGKWYTSRVSACSLLHLTLPHFIQDAKACNQLMRLHSSLCSDPTPMVRRQACGYLGRVAKVLDVKTMLDSVFPSFVKLCKDPDDSVRLLTVQACVDLLQLMVADDPVNAVTRIAPITLTLCVDKSWRVRYNVANKLTGIIEIVRPHAEGKMPTLTDGYVRLLQDGEPEVRTAAASHISTVAKLVGSQVTLAKLVPSIKALSRDSCNYTRAAVAGEALCVASVVSAEELTTHLLPIYRQLLEDTDSDVRLAMISKLGSLDKLVGREVLASSLLPAIIDIAVDKRWRVRLSAIKHMPGLAGQLGLPFFEANLSDLCVNWLGDQVFSIRQAATKNLAKLSLAFGGEWATSHIVPKVVNLGTHKSSLFRMTALIAMKDMAPTLSSDACVNRFLPITLSLAEDQVPNVRFNAAKTLPELAKVADSQEVTQSITATLERLFNDRDPDVMFFAHQSLALIKERAC